MEAHKMEYYNNKKGGKGVCMECKKSTRLAKHINI